MILPSTMLPVIEPVTLPVSIHTRPIPRQVLTIRDTVTYVHINPVLPQLTLLLLRTGSRYEYWTRRELMIRQMISWYQGIEIGKIITIDVDTRLEIVGCR